MKLTKKVVIGACGAVALCALGAELISGDFNTTLGYLAGQNATGDRITAMGAGAAGESSSNERSSFFGAACGAYSQYLVECIGVGYRALKNAADSTGSMFFGNHAGEDSTAVDGTVAIGDRAACEANSCSNCVFIGNGAGASKTNLTNCIFIGKDAGAGMSGEGCIDIGGAFMKDTQPYIKYGDINEYNMVFERSGTIQIGYRMYGYFHYPIWIDAYSGHLAASYFDGGHGGFYDASNWGAFCVDTGYTKQHETLEELFNVVFAEIREPKQVSLKDEDTDGTYIIKVKNGQLKLYSCSGSTTNEVGTIQVTPSSN